MGEAQRNKAREEMRRREREFTFQKLRNGLIGFIAGLTFPLWLPILMSWECYKENKPFWKDL